MNRNSAVFALDTISRILKGKQTEFRLPADDQAAPFEIGDVIFDSFIVKEVKLEHLHDITEEGAQAQGCDGRCPIGSIRAYQESPLVYHFAQLWEDLYGEDTWEKNPLVWVVKFAKIEI